ncbi:hypothetical protein MYCO108962_05850 [Mycobacterium colombiense]|nr:hypothetical protein [Mycobacterium colombiense]
MADNAVIGQTLAWVRDRTGDNGRPLTLRLPVSEVVHYVSDVLSG